MARRSKKMRSKRRGRLAEYSGLLTLADDSGLEVDALNGAPGILFRALLPAKRATTTKNNRKLLRELARLPQKNARARFVCALALCAPDEACMI